ncbi:MAG: tetratricopeptide repeat protein [Spirochaetaceae bacterium]|nr:tetratricopeptide repeat protein [Spirochaetaceae bacterium]
MKMGGSMKKNIRRLLLLACVLLGAAACSRQNQEIAGRLYELESPEYEGASRPGAEARIAELEKDVAALKKAVEEKVSASDKLGSYYKLLAIAYLDKKMYGKALEAIEEAIRIHPEQHSLFIYRAIAAARLAKALNNDREREAYLKTAEDSYLRAISLNSASNQALYGLAVLYVYELDQPENALPFVERILRRESRNIDAMFLLATTHYLLGNTEAALETYDRIIATSNAGTRRDEAKKNKERILEEAMR